MILFIFLQRKERERRKRKKAHHNPTTTLLCTRAVATKSAWQATHLTPF